MGRVLGWLLRAVRPRARETPFHREMRRARAFGVNQRRASLQAQRADRGRHDALTDAWRGCPPLREGSRRGGGR